MASGMEMKFNPTKYKHIMFGGKRVHITDITYSLYCLSIPKESDTKYLESR